MKSLCVVVFTWVNILAVWCDQYASETHRRRQERSSPQSRTVRSTAQDSVLMESTSYTDANVARDREIELRRQAKMFKTSSILSSLLQDYDSRLRPQFGGEPVEVRVTIHVDSLGPISETDMSFRVDFAFRQYWYDKRLEFADQSNESITLSHEFLEKIWLPDTYFPESLSANKHSVMVPNILLRLSPDGGVLYSCRVTVVSKCPMNLKYFPLDTQSCSLLIEAYGYTAKDLKLSWKQEVDEEGQPKEAVQVAESIELSQFEFIPDDIITQAFELKFSTGNFSDLQVTFKFERTLLYFVLQSYVPATLIVKLSWVSFWVDPRSIPARASLAITTVLTMITLMGTVNSQLPKVSNIKALDVYFGMCFFYVFGALIEFSAVCYLDKNRQKSNARKKEAEKVAKETQEAEQNRLKVLKEVDGLAMPSNLNNNEDILIHRSSLYSTGLGMNGMGMDQQQPLLNNNSSQMGSMGLLPRSLNRTMSGTPSTASTAPTPGNVSRGAFNRQSTFDETTPKKSNSGSPPSSLSCWSNFDVLKIDNYSRVMFPSTFLVLNLLYWGAYTNIMNTVTHADAEQDDHSF